LAVLGALVVGLVFLRDLWCRYLCPYGALLGLLGRVAPLEVTRDPGLCTGCEGCRRVCPARLPVHSVRRVSSVECTNCQDCIAACPVGGCLTVRAPKALPIRMRLRPFTPVLIAVVLYLGVATGFRIAGHWQTEITEVEYHRRRPEIDSPFYSHPRKDARCLCGRLRFSSVP